MTSEATTLWFVVSGLVPTLKVVVAFGHLKLIFTAWPASRVPGLCGGGRLECIRQKD